MYSHLISNTLLLPFVVITNFQAMDKQFLEKFGCVCPIRTNSYFTEKHCLLNTSFLEPYLKFEYNSLDEICPLDCSSMTILFSISDQTKGNENEAYAKIYFKNHIKVSKSFIGYTEISLMAELGGYIGLLLGISLMDINSIANFFIDYCCTKFLLWFKK